MSDKNNSFDSFHFPPSGVDLDLLAALLEPEDATYPWNQADEQAESYFHHLEQQFDISDLPSEELTTQSQNFYNHLDNIWCKIRLQKVLHSTFTINIPHSWLDAIAQKAVKAFADGQLKTEQLVACVQDLLPNWGVDDLLVLARPVAYAMRSGEQQAIPSQDWERLSEVEQAKVSLAIAHYALTQLKNFDNP